MNNPPKGDDTSEEIGRLVRVNDYVEILTRHQTKGKGTVVAIRDNHGQWPNTLVLKMDSDTIYADIDRLPGWPHDRVRIAGLGVFDGEVVRVIHKTLH